MSGSKMDSGFISTNWECVPTPTIRWWTDNRNKQPVLQRLEAGEGVKNGEPYHYERWVNVELIIEEPKHEEKI